MKQLSPLEKEIEKHRMRAIMFDRQAQEEQYLYECLSVLKNIQDCGDCNICARSKDCQYAPTLGQTVRYNCPFYLKTLKEGDPE